MHVRLNGEPFRKWIVLSTWGQKWQPIQDVKGKVVSGAQNE